MRHSFIVMLHLHVNTPTGCGGRHATLHISAVMNARTAMSLPMTSGTEPVIGCFCPWSRRLSPQSLDHPCLILQRPSPSQALCATALLPSRTKAAALHLLLRLRRAPSQAESPGSRGPRARRPALPRNQPAPVARASMLRARSVQAG